MKKKLKSWVQEKLVNPKFKKAFEEEYEKLSIGEQLAKLRLQAGLTQAEVAKKVKTTASAISRYENGEYDRYDSSWSVCRHRRRWSGNYCRYQDGCRGSSQMFDHGQFPSSRPVWLYRHRHMEGYFRQRPAHGSRHDHRICQVDDHDSYEVN